ncbi:MAG: hypothetical protein AB7P40_25785 [Chloroflexota bacterium]
MMARMRGTARDRRARREQPLEVGDRVRAKTTLRTGEVTGLSHDGAGDQVRVAYDDAPQDEYLTTPAKNGVELPRELVDRE